MVVTGIVSKYAAQLLALSILESVLVIILIIYSLYHFLKVRRLTNDIIRRRANN